MSGAIRLGTTLVKGRVVNITLSENGPGYNRLTSAIQLSLKNAAADMVGKRVADGKVFGDGVMNKVTEIRIWYVAVAAKRCVQPLTEYSNMTHPSAGDSSMHYSVEAWDDNSKLNDGHVPEDESKQTVSVSPALLVQESTRNSCCSAGCQLTLPQTYRPAVL
jgi:hypothetical protein